MTSQWNWYAMQELKSKLTREGLTCPHCETNTHKISVDIDNPKLHCGHCDSDFSPVDYMTASRRCPPSGTTILYRPIGEKELAKIESANFEQFPPRLHWQPIFYPVLTQEYADAIARNWNSTDADHNYVGFVTRFEIRNEYLCDYEIQRAADNTTLEYWVPAEHIDVFNENIVGTIDVIAEFRHGQLVASTIPGQSGMTKME